MRTPMDLIQQTKKFYQRQRQHNLHLPYRLFWLGRCSVVYYVINYPCNCFPINSLHLN
jgi:hypothetical protein